MTTATELQNPGALMNAAMALMPQESELPPPTVDILLHRIVRDAEGKTLAKYERTVRLAKLRETTFSGRFATTLDVDYLTLAQLATDADLLMQVRPEQVIEAAVAFAKATRPADLMVVSRTLWFLLAAQRGARLDLHQLGAQTIETGEGF
jgi:hypothetical protein